MVIAELCQNHNGDVTLLKEMTLSAIEAGARAVKIQTFFACDLTENFQFDRDRMKNLELDWQAHQEFFDICKNAKVIPITSVYSAKYMPYLHDIGFKYVKIGSAQARDKQLILKYISTGFSVIVSTGGNNLSDIPAIGPLAGILHCVSLYPHHWSQSNLNRLYDIRKRWPNTSFGFSDHSDPISNDWAIASKLAMAMGSTWIERHYTMLPRDETKDGPVSITYDQLKILCQIDALSLHEKIKLLPPQLFFYPQTDNELNNIKNYEGRWIKD